MTSHIDHSDFEKSKSPMFVKNLVYRPFSYPKAVEFDEAHEKLHWHQDEIPLGDDVKAWNSGLLTEGEKNYTTNILKFFTTQDVMVGTYQIDYLAPVIKNNEIRCMIVGFAGREKVHQRAYALFTDTIGLPETEYSAFLNYSEMKDKAEFAMIADSSTIRGLALSLAKTVFNEGISLFASFVMLLNFQRYGKLMGLGKILEWSIRDETMHCMGFSWLFRQVCEENKRIVTDKFKKEIYDMVRTIVSLEFAFIDMVYQDYEIEGLSKENVKEYIMFIADRRLLQLGLKPNYNVKVNPLPWLEWTLNASNHTNFFENKVSEYEVGRMQGENNWGGLSTSYKIVGRDGCPYCVKAVEDIISNGDVYEEIKINDQVKRNEFYDDNNLVGKDRTVPQIWKIENDGSETYIGGYTQLLKHINS